MYQEQPAARVAGAVVWHAVRRPDGPPARVLPDGCMDLIWSSADGLLVAGPDTVAHLATAGPPGHRYVGIRLAPGVGPAVFGPPADELRDRRVPLAALWPGRAVRRAEDQLARAGDAPAGRLGATLGSLGHALESVVLARLAAVGGADPLAAAVTARFATGARVADVAAGLELGPRQLHRRCRPLFGYGPKTLARILRLQRALALVRAGAPAALAAAGSGYADQPHFARDVRALAGVPLGALGIR